MTHRTPAIPCRIVEVGTPDNGGAPHVWLEPVRYEALDGEVVAIEVTVNEARRFAALLGQVVDVTVEVAS